MQRIFVLTVGSLKRKGVGIHLPVTTVYGGAGGTIKMTDDGEGNFTTKCRCGKCSHFQKCQQQVSGEIQSNNGHTRKRKTAFAFQRLPEEAGKRWRAVVAGARCSRRAHGTVPGSRWCACVLRINDPELWKGYKNPQNNASSTAHASCQPL